MTLETARKTISAAAEHGNRVDPEAVRDALRVIRGVEWRTLRIPTEDTALHVADKLHETHGTQVRVDGHCGCPSPREWFKGFAVELYHIDTQEGLNALAAALRSVYDPEKDPDATPRTGGKA